MPLRKKIVREVDVIEVLQNSVSFKDCIEEFGLSDSMALMCESGADLPCYFDHLMHADRVENLEQAEVALQAALSFGAANEETVLLVSVTSKEPAHVHWLELAKELQAPFTTTQRGHDGTKRLIYTILFAATPYVSPVAKPKAPPSAKVAVAKKPVAKPKSKWA